MLTDKDIAKIQEIKTFFQDSWTRSDFYAKQLEFFRFSKTSKISTNGSLTLLEKIDREHKLIK